MTKLYMTYYNTESGGAGRFITTLKEKLKDIYEITHDLKDTGIDLALVNANSIKYEDLLDFKYRNPNTPIIHRLDGLASREDRPQGDSSLYFLNNLTDYTIFQSKSAVNDFKEIINHFNFEIIYNGSSFKPTAKKDYSGELKIYNSSWAAGSWKQLDKVFDFIKKMDGNNQVHFYLFGNYQPLKFLQSKGVVIPRDLNNGVLKELNDYLFKDFKNVHYSGYLYPDKSVDIISNMDYLLFPSIKDTCPNTVIESLCCHVPVVYHNSGGTPELVLDAGLDIEKYNYDYDRLVLDMLDKKESLKEKAKIRSSSLSIDYSNKKYLEVFDKILENTPKKTIAAKDLKVGWVMSYLSTGGSSRIGGFNIHQALLKIGVSSQVLHANSVFSVNLDVVASEVIAKIISNKINLVVLQKVCVGEVVKIVDWCNKNNVKIVYAVGDVLPNTIYGKVDGIITCSPHFVDRIKKEYPSSKKIFYIEDGIEVDPEVFKNHKEKEDITLGWFGNRDKLTEIKQFKDKLNIPERLFTISNTEDADYTMGYGCSEDWSADTLAELLIREVDIGIIPIDTSNPKNLVKSANRLTLFMSLGIPVIASPISSYECVASNYKGTVFFSDFDDLDSWRKNIDDLREIRYRRLSGSKARNTVIHRYSMDVSAKEWALSFLELFK